MHVVWEEFAVTELATHEEVIVGGEELGGAPSEGGIVASSSFPSFIEPRFIEPVGL